VLVVPVDVIIAVVVAVLFCSTWVRFGSRRYDGPNVYVVVVLPVVVLVVVVFVLVLVV